MRKPDPDDYHGGPPRLHRGGHRLRAARAAVIRRHVTNGVVGCGRCGGAIDLGLSGMHPLGFTLGHVVPVSRGGGDDLDNLRPEHRRCNLAASARRDPPIARVARGPFFGGGGADAPLSPVARNGARTGRDT